MSLDTGLLSLVLGISFIIISAGGIVFIYSKIKNGSLEDNKIDKLIELGKWFITSVGLVLSISMVSDGFKERDQDLKEFVVFDKYMEVIFDKATDSLQKRKLLSDYFTSVSPTGAIKDGWGEYRKLVMADIKEYNQAKQLIDKINEKKIKQKQLEPEESKALASAEAKVALLNLNLAEWVIITGSDKSLDEAQYEVNKIKKYPVHIRKKGNLYMTVVGPFLNSDEASIALPEIKKEEGVRPDSYIVDFKTLCKTTEMKKSADNKYTYTECKL